MKKLLFVALAALFAVPFSQAYTAQEIAAKGKAWRSLNHPHNQTYSNVPTTRLGNIDLSYDAENDLLVVSKTIDPWGNDMTEMPLKIRINGSQASLSFYAINKLMIKFGTRYYKSAKKNVPAVFTANYVMLKSAGGSYYGICPAQSDGNPISWYNNGDNATTITGTVTKSADGNFSIRFDNLYMCQVAGTTSSFNGYYYMNDDGVFYYTSQALTYWTQQSNYTTTSLTINTYDPNATVTDRIVALSNGNETTTYSDREYTANVSLDGDDVTIINWDNKGQPWEFGVNAAGTLFVANENKWLGYIDRDDLTVSMYATECFADFKNDYGYYRAMGVMQPDKPNVPANMVGDISGTYVHEGDHRWVEQPDARTLLKDVVFDFEDYSLYQQMTNSWLTKTKNAKYKTDLTIDVTHSLKVNRNEYGYGAIDATGNKFLYINCHLSDFANSSAVDGYELYVVPGAEHTYTGSDYQHADGHARATRIDVDKYATTFMPERNEAITLADGDENLPQHVYNLLVPEADLSKDANGKYSVYVKTKYTAGSGLEDSFHAMTPLGETTTSISDIDADFTDNGPARYYTLGGVEVSKDNLMPGIYVKRQGNRSTKVLVK